MRNYFEGVTFEGMEAMQAACKAIERIYDANVATALELTVKRNIYDSPVFMRALHDILLNEACKQNNDDVKKALFTAATACIHYMNNI